jgi:peptide/nickel transport system permease protein
MSQSEQIFPEADVRPQTRRRRAAGRGILRSGFPRIRLGLLLAGLFVGLLGVAAVRPGLLASADPLGANSREAFRAPSLAIPLGTDENGRDVLSRIVYGARPTLVIGLAATAIGLVAGLSIGLVAGLGPRPIDGLIMRFVDVLLAFPDILLALVIIALWGAGTVNVIVAIGVASIPRYARLVRAQAHVVRGAPYVEAARALGLRRSAVIFRHVLPNAIKPALVFATLGIGMKISAGAALSFLGLGAPPPAPEWGSMLAIGRDFLANAWWLTAAPAAAITLTVLSIVALGREFIRRGEGKPL